MSHSQNCYGFELWPEEPIFLGQKQANRNICSDDVNGIGEGDKEGKELSGPSFSFTDGAVTVSENRLE